MGKKQKADYQHLAREIIENVGGKENVISLRHCVTRVRFRLKEEGKADDQKIKSLDGVITVVKGGGEYMVVIGNKVADVYDAICVQLGMPTGESQGTSTGTTKQEKGNIVMRILNTVVGAVIPALNMICAGGVLKGILTILTMTGLMSSESGMYLLLSGLADAIFYFLPIALGYNLSSKLGGDPFLGMVIGATLCYPTLNGVDIQLFGMTVNATYTSSFLPAVIITAISVPVFKWLNRHIPKAVSGFLSPVITLGIMIPLGFAFIGPAATALGRGINGMISMLLNFSPVLAGMVVCGLYQVLVLLGIHSAMTSFSFMNVLSGTPDAIMALISFPCFAQIGVVLAMYLKSKDRKLKDVALPAFISGIFGVTEPAIYGVTLPRIKMFVVSCIGAATAGIVVMLSGTLMYSFTGMGVVSLLGMVNPENPSFVGPVLAAAVPFIVSFIMAFIIYKENTETEEISKGTVPTVEQKATEDQDEAEASEQKHSTVIIEAPVPGKVVPLSEVPDETFSSGLLGSGFAVEPSEGKVMAPFDGICEMVFDTRHAIGLRSDTGVVLLIHVGLETVNLGGKPFTPHVKNGDRIQKGQILMEFDMEAIKAANCPLITPVLVTNADEIGTVKIEQDKMIIGG